MNNIVVTRWEDLRGLVDGAKKHRDAVERYLSTHAGVLYYGDSWFSTPLYPNLARQSAAAIDGLRMIVGKPGAQAADLLAPAAVARLADRVRNNPFDVVCISAGGNDVLSDRLKAGFRPWMESSQPHIDAKQAFDRIRDQGFFQRLVDRYDRCLVEFAKINKGKRWLRVVGHTYAPPQRIGVAGDLTIDNIGLIAILKDDVGPWLYGPMKRVLPDVAEARKFARLLLVDGFRDLVMKPMAQKYQGFFSCADLSSIDLADDRAWYDEIHPTAAGFARLAPTLNAAIRAAVPAAKRDSVS